jgi:hypothetical protein
MVEIWFNQIVLVQNVNELTLRSLYACIPTLGETTVCLASMNSDIGYFPTFD